MSKVLWSIAILIVCAYSVLGVAQNRIALINEGRDFYIGYIPPSANCSNTTQYRNVSLLITSRMPATVIVSYSDEAGVAQSGTAYQLAAHSSKRIKLIVNAMKPADAKGEGEGEFKSCHITSTTPITVQYYSTGPNACGMYMAIPTHALGKEYTVQTLPANPGIGHGAFKYECEPDSSASAFMVIAAYDNTLVEIHNTGFTNKGRTGISYGKAAAGIDKNFTVTLRKGQCYLVRSTVNDPLNSMDGTYIKAAKPIVVIAAQENAFLGRPNILKTNDDDLRDYTIEQMIPMEYWDSKGYYTMPLYGSSSIHQDSTQGELFHIYSATDSNHLSIALEQGVATPIIGKFSTLGIGQNVTIPQEIRSTDTQKIAVQMFDYRQEWEEAPYPAPSQTNVIPESRWRTTYSWSVPNDEVIALQNHFCNIILPKDSLHKVFLSANGSAGQDIAQLAVNTINSFPNRPDLIGITIPLQPAAYEILGNTKCAVYLYGREAFDRNEGANVKGNEGDNYFFSYSTIAGQAYGDESVPGAIHVTVTPSSVKWGVTIEDTDKADLGLHEISLLYDPIGYIAGKPYISSNVEIEPQDYELITGTTEERIGIKIVNPFYAAVAYLHVVNGVGKDTVVTLIYKAPPLTVTKGIGTGAQDSVDFGLVRVGTENCTYLQLKNISEKGGQSFTISSVKQLLNDKDFKIVNTVPPIKPYYILELGDSIRINVCYQPSDTNAHWDSLIIETGWFRGKVYMGGKGITPLTIATDYTFPETLVYDTIQKSVVIKNVGTASLRLGKDFTLSDSINFSVDRSQFPQTLLPGQSTSVVVRFHPQSELKDSVAVFWQTDMPVKYQGSIKDYSILKGIGVKPGIYWDRAVQFDTIPLDLTKIVRVYLYNRSTSRRHVDSIMLQGDDVSEYKILDNSLGFDPLVNFDMDTGDSIWIDILIKPNPLLHTDSLATSHALLQAFHDGDTSTIEFETVVLSTSGVRSIQEKNSFSIFPNPSRSGSVTLSYDAEHSGEAELRITDVLGRTIYQNKLHLVLGRNNIPVNLPAGCSGIYYVYLQTNNVLHSGKVIMH